MASRIPLLAGNWKMNLDHLEATYFVQKLVWLLRDARFDYSRCEIALMPSFTSLRSVQVLVEADKLKIRYGAQAPLCQGDPYGSFRYVRVGGATSADPDEFSSLKDSILFPMIRERKPVWNQQPNQHGDLTEQGLFYAQKIKDQIENPPENWLVFDQRYKTPSIEPAALEPDNGNGWYDASTAGNSWICINLASSLSVSGANFTVSFSAGQLQFQIDN